MQTGDLAWSPGRLAKVSRRGTALSWLLGFDGTLRWWKVAAGWGKVATAMKFTQYFLAMRQRSDRMSIQMEWIEKAVQQPEREAIQQDGRVRRWARIPEADGRWLRGVVGGR